MGSEVGAIDEADFINGNVSNNIGLIPRFLSDMFDSLFRRREASEKASLRISQQNNLSLLLISEYLHHFWRCMEMIFSICWSYALKIREDANKEVVVVGLTQVQINECFEHRDDEPNNCCNVYELHIISIPCLLHSQPPANHTQCQWR